MDYLRFKRPREADAQGALSPFSNLFALLGFVFLLLYALGTLQAGVLSIASRQEARLAEDRYRQALEGTIASYEKRMAGYEIEKEQYLRDHGTVPEVQVYKEVLNKLYLLRQEAKDQHDQHEARAQEYAQKEKELEEYRILIADMARSSLVSKARLLQTQASMEKLEARKQGPELRSRIAARLRAEFAKAGVRASVDPRTGEVTIPFAEVHFGYDSADLKPAMKKVLNKAIPAYARSLLQDKDTRDAISSLEVVGFASPTYLGKYVDPVSLDSRARKSVNYNMDLSYRRAKAIFTYMFDRKQMRFSEQGRMLRMTKVSGLSHLQAQPARDPAASGKASPKAQNFCRKYDCAAHQKVVLRFNLKDTSGPTGADALGATHGD